MPAAIHNRPRSALARLAPLVSAMLLGGCQVLPANGTDAQANQDPMAGAPPIERGLDGQGLANLLTAEFAGQRGDYRRATRGFLGGADRYDSLALIERAALAARLSNDRQLLAEAADRWQRLAPQAEEPARLLASLAMQEDDWSTALAQRLRIHALSGEGDLSAFIETALAESADPAPLLGQLRDHLAELGETDDARRHEAELATAQLEVAAGQTARAERRIERLTTQSPELPALWVTKARLAEEQGDHRLARDAARRGLTIAPGDPRLVLMLAQSELRLDNVSAAENQTDALLDSQEGNHDLRLALARLYLEEGEPAPARRLLLPLVAEGDTPSMAFLLLGAIAEEDREIDNALLYYRQVPPGEHFLQARLNAAEMLINDDRLLDARAFLRIERMRHEDYFTDLVSLEVELLQRQGRSAEADDLLDRELERTPNDEQLLYLRGMRAWQNDDFDGMERDLGRIIERNPDSAMALNALGYTLVELDLEDRLGEARQMIERAHEIEPDSPAILDSLGWLHFREGDPRGALPWLEKAYAAMPDQEIAAHLAEVLWVLDRQEAARALVREALERFDDRPALDELLERLPALAP